MRQFFLLVIVVLLSGQNRASAQTFTFNYTGGVQSWTVPPCVTSIEVDAQGAIGGHTIWSRGGNGGYVHCMLAVTPGTIMEIYVGGKGDTSTPALPGAGGFNGGAIGAHGGSFTGSGAGGGGASDIRIPPYSLANRIIVAAGGGGGGEDCWTIDADLGGFGGGLTGIGGNGCSGSPGPYSLGGGYGGTPTAGGAGGSYTSWIPGNNGTFGSGGSSGVSFTTLSTGGGGGGGGWYGGGGSWGGGGGGSSYADPVLATGVAHITGYNSSGDGTISITLPCNAPGAIKADTFLVCEGDSVLLNDTGAISCGIWSSSDSAICVPGTVPGYIRGISAGTAVITYNISNPCGSALAYQTLTVIPAPLAINGKTGICPGDSTLLLDFSPHGLWSSINPAIAIIGTTSGEVTGISAGTATIVYTIITGCKAYTTVTVNCYTGIGETIAPDKNKVEVFPNPSYDNLTIKMNDMTYHSFAIANSIGQVFIARHLNAIQTSVNVKMLPSGLYYIMLRGAYGSNIQKFMKE